MSFIITESPAKAKKIQGFLGKDYTVKSSVGHIRGIDTKWANTDVVIELDCTKIVRIIPKNIKQQPFLDIALFIHSNTIPEPLFSPITNL